MKSIFPPENIEPNKVNVEIWRTTAHQSKSADLKLQNMQTLWQKFFAVIANMADDLSKNRTQKDKKVISQTIKDSIRKCADVTVFLGKVNQDILNLRREKVASELNQNDKQLTFKTEDHPKLLFRDDLPKIIKDISETNKADQSLTQRYQSTLKREMFTKTGKPFIEKPGLSAKRKNSAEFSTISVLPTKASTKPLAPDFQIHVSELVHKIKFLNEKSRAGDISDKIKNWKGLASDE